MGSFLMTDDVLTLSSATHVTAMDLVGHSSSVLCGSHVCDDDDDDDRRDGTILPLKATCPARLSWL